MRNFFGCIVLLILSALPATLNAQSCFNVNAGNDTLVSCLQTCLNLKAKVPDVRSSDDYQVIPIAYTPFPYTNATGVVFNPSYQDDNYSDEVILPFTFCFYGRRYTSCVVGTNGIVTFDVETNKNTYNAYILSDPIPFAGGVPNDGNVAYYPRAAIMGPYHDIDPAPASTPQPPKRKMEYIISGTAPCRKFILNFYQIPYFACGNAIVTQQMVLYEGTGIIDIFIENKPYACAASSNNGTAILGVQNWERDQARWVQGRNNTVWSANKEGWRFVPNGSTSLLNRVELYKNNMLVSTGTTINLGNGELEATFANICQSQDSMSYVVKAFYNQCDNPALETEGSDTMIVYKSLNPIDKNIINASCAGDNGSITITNPLAANIEYSIDAGATWQTSNTFNKPAGSYTISARVIGSLCGGSTTATIAQPDALNAVANTTAATCNGDDGTITISANGGTPAYQFSIDNGISYQNNTTFITTPGTYNNIKIKDANGCITSTTASVTLNDQMFLDLGIDTTICFGNTITLTPQTNKEANYFKWLPATGLNDDAVKNPLATPNDTTQYTLNAKWGVCQRTDAIWIKVLHKPVAYAGKDSTVCYKTPALLNGKANNLSGTVNYTWSPATNVTPANAAAAIAKPDTTQLYTLSVTDNYGCNFLVTDDVLVSMRPPVPAFAGNDTNAIYGIPHQLFSSGGKFYTWSPSTHLNNPFAQKPLATLYNDTYFSLLVTDDIGCTNTDEVFIKVYKGPTYYLPNAFTPNGDGLNDVFRAVPVGISLTNYFNVYNRFGELVFQTNQWLKGWDGTYKGKKAASGTYVWLIKGMDKYGKVVEMKGTVILIQ
ncbi:T9SS type B sorting domain-containing protein [Ferruginibacter sp.]|nr:T9SS type B sorting domain-containing protein [Ferruginibacter sp.]